MLFSIADIRSSLSWPIAWAPSRASAAAAARALGIPNGDVLITEQNLETVEDALLRGCTGALPSPEVVKSERTNAPSPPAAQLAAEVR